MTPTPKGIEMNDQNTLAEKVQKIAAEMRDAMRREDDGYPYAEFLSDMGDYIKDLEALLPAPPRPTMADMTEEERHECRWMQCDAGPYGRRGLIIDTGKWAVYVADKETGVQSNYSPDLVTARPDLPRMEWNGTEKVEDENKVKIGDEIESADDPRLAALPVGTILLDSDGEKVTRFDVNPWAWRGPGYVPIAGEGTEYGSWVVVRIGQETDQ